MLARLHRPGIYKRVPGKKPLVMKKNRGRKSSQKFDVLASNKPGHVKLAEGVQYMY